MYDEGKLHEENEFIDFITCEKNVCESYISYMLYIVTFYHEDGSEWNIDDILDIGENNNRFLF